jgi:uncharacterized protein (TIGR02444 family)
MDRPDNACLDLEGPHWSFAVDLYRQPGVAKACLLLQDTLKVDVCLLLFALFAAKELRSLLDRKDLQDLDRAISDWRREVVWPLRSIRRRLKTEPFVASSTDALLGRIKGAEIDAEQIELAVLAQHFGKRRRSACTDAIDMGSVLDRVVTFFTAQTDSAGAAVSPEIRAAVQVIAHAVAQR